MITTLIKWKASYPRKEWKGVHVIEGLNLVETFSDSTLTPEEMFAGATNKLKRVLEKKYETKIHFMKLTDLTIRLV